MIYLMVFFCLCFPLQQHAVVIEQIKKIPESSSYHYQFFDLGETDLPIEQLSKYALPVSYAPQINDQSQVTCNQSRYGVLKGPTLDFMNPQIASLRANCFALNNRGDLIAAFEHSYTDVAWWLWMQKEFTKSGEIRIKLDDLPGQDLHLRSINDARMAVGVFKPSGMLRPIIWTPEEGLHHLGYYLGWDIAGVLWDVNQFGYAVGYLEEDGLRIPFVWSKKFGLDRLLGFKSLWKTAACKELTADPQFADLVIGDDNLLYGTFWDSADHRVEGKDLTQAFWWDPRSGSFRQLQLDGMRINAISSSQTFVGSCNGRAALCDLGNHPVYLDELIRNLDTHWTLLDATDINAFGDISGYGLSQGKPHIFLIKRA